MEPLRRKSVAEHAAALLIHEIATGRLKGRLPSTRNLALLMKLSRPNVLEALKEVERKGLIERTSPRCAYWVSNSHIERNEHAREFITERHALFIVEENVTQHEAFQLLLLLAMRLQPKGWRISMLSMKCGHDEYRPRQWKRAIEGYAPDKVIVWSGRPHFAQWLYQAGIPALFIGGDSGDTPVPICGTSSLQAAGTILDAFFEMGHERIWVPFCNRTCKYTEKLQTFIKHAFESRRLAFSERWHFAVSPYRSPELILAMFEETWRTFRPTALMFHDWREYLAVSAVLRREGLDIPMQMSVALIGDDPEMAWHQPELAHFTHPLSRICATCIAWLNSDKPRHEKKNIIYQTEWCPGASIGPPRKD